WLPIGRSQIRKAKMQGFNRHVIFWSSTLLLIWLSINSIGCSGKLPPPQAPQACLTTSPPERPEVARVMPCPVAVCLDATAAITLLNYIQSLEDYAASAWTKCQPVAK